MVNTKQEATPKKRPPRIPISEMPIWYYEQPEKRRGNRQGKRKIDTQPAGSFVDLAAEIRAKYA